MSSGEIFNPDFYPVGLNLQDKTVLMVGGGTVATRKLHRLCITGCRITVVSPQFSETLLQLAGSAESVLPMTLMQQPYGPMILEQLRPDLVFACTNDKAVNRQVAADAKRLRVWANCATDGVAQSDFIVPGLITYDNLQIALFSGGASPLLIHHLRETLESMIGPWIIPYMQVIREIRQEIQQRVADENQRKQLNETVLADTAVLQAIRDKALPPEAVVAQLRQTLFSTTP